VLSCALCVDIAPATLHGGMPRVGLEPVPPPTGIPRPKGAEGDAQGGVWLQDIVD
jgi:hypothetical protein